MLLLQTHRTATVINASILLIALPDIFRGIGIDPLAPGNTATCCG